MTVESIAYSDQDNESRGRKEAEELLMMVEAGHLEDVRAKILDRYEEFRPVADGLRRELETDPMKVYARAIGKGNEALGVPVEVGGDEFILRLPLGSGKSRPMGEKLEGAVRGLGIRGLEQVAAASIEDGVFISERVPGVKIRKLDLEHQRQVTAEHVRDLVHAVIEANARGISIDPDQGNILYDQKAGFGVVDYYYKEGTAPRLAETLALVAGSINGMGRGVWSENADERAAYQRFGSELLTSFEQQCAQVLDRVDFEEVQQRIWAMIDDNYRISQKLSARRH